VGHSTRSAAELLELLDEHGIRLLVDVRRFPGSRRHPHFGSAPLAAALAAGGIGYRHAPELGGRRDARPESPNTAWRNAGFRAYADHLATPEFRQALAVLLADAAAQPTTVMCAEAVPWRCHRQLIADAAVAAGVEVMHILGRGRCDRHALNAAARVAADGTVTYPGGQPDLFGEGSTAKA
jgi:uncharacterized protein (DUF488 family)